MISDLSFFQSYLYLMNSAHKLGKADQVQQFYQQGQNAVENHAAESAKDSLLGVLKTWYDAHTGAGSFDSDKRGRFGECGKRI